MKAKLFTLVAMLFLLAGISFPSLALERCSVIPTPNPALSLATAIRYPPAPWYVISAGLVYRTVQSSGVSSPASNQVCAAVAVEIYGELPLVLDVDWIGTQAFTVPFVQEIFPDPYYGILTPPYSFSAYAAIAYLSLPFDSNGNTDLDLLNAGPGLHILDIMILN